MRRELPEYSPQELMVVAASRLIDDGATVFIGTGLPIIAAYVAKHTHAPRCVMIFESGVIDAFPKELAAGVTDFRLMTNASKISGLYYALGLLQGGFIDIGFLGGAEVDKYGNLNSTVIGPYAHPKVRLPGSGGANDIGSLAKRVVIVMLHKKERFPERVQYITTPGYLSGGDSRLQAGLRGGGPQHVITDLAVLGFDPISKAMQLESLHPGVSLEEVQDNTGFELLIPKEVPSTSPPTPQILALIRDRIDPTGLYIPRRTS
jgi:acyl CoA:acetate/3-ketoacid CoA transferase beta subunit